jgi:transketolase
MALSDADFKRLSDKARYIRRQIINITGWAGGGHCGGALSQTDLLVLLYYKYLRIDPKQPKWPDRDRFILSKGHGGIGLAPILADLGYFDPDLLHEFNHTGSPFGMHLDAAKVPGVEASTGSLGHGMPMAVGLALAARYLGKTWRTIVMVSDGELCEGSNWEAAMCAAHHHPGNLIAIIDRNRQMIDGPTEKIMSLEPLADKWRAFRWHVIEIDGHDLNAIDRAYEQAFAWHDGPVVVLARTVKGKGVDFMEDRHEWHYGGLDGNALEKALASIDRT